jgi:hypothetical protein
LGFRRRPLRVDCPLIARDLPWFVPSRRLSEVGMAGQVTLRGRFSAGTVVRLVRVAHEGVLRPEGGEEVDVQTAEKDENGVASVSFKSGAGRRMTRRRSSSSRRSNRTAFA